MMEINSDYLNSRMAFDGQNASQIADQNTLLWLSKNMIWWELHSVHDFKYFDSLHLDILRISEKCVPVRPVSLM
jgi:hypothetical protein